jgi:hypothetical protein
MPLGAQGQINGPLSLASQGLPQIILTPQGQIINVTSLIERVGAIPIILLQMINLQSQVEQTQKLVQLQLLQSQQPQWQLMQSQLLGQQLDQSKLQQGIPPLNQPISEISLLQQLQQLQQLKSQQLQLQQLQQAQQLQQQQLQQLQKSQKEGQSTSPFINSTGTSLQSKNDTLNSPFNPLIYESPLLQQQQLQQQLQQVQQLQQQQLQQLQQVQQLQQQQLQQIQQSVVVQKIPTSNNSSSPLLADTVNSTSIKNNQSTTTKPADSVQPVNQTIARG